MDRKWMSANRLSREYWDGVDEFIEFAFCRDQDPRGVICPYLKCCYRKRVKPIELKDHLICNGIDPTYTCWTMHGETRNNASDWRDSASYSTFDRDSGIYDVDRLDEMIDVIEEDLRDCPEMFERLKSDADKPLYPGCKKFTKLSVILKLYNLKAANGWSDKSFTDLLELLYEMLLEYNELPPNTYEAKKVLCSIGMSYEKIHAYPNDCVLFQKEYSTLDKCPKCDASRYKRNGCINPFVPVIYYLDSLRDSDFKNYKSMRILFNQ